jgi:micrococcal nuclease
MVARMKNIRAAILICMIPVLFLGCQPRDASRTSVTVTSVVDGDTIRVIYRGKKQLVRLTGIDTPEERLNEKAQRDAKRSGIDVNLIMVLGRRSTRFTRSLVRKKDTVFLEFDVKKKDEYGRLLAYVWLPDGRLLNEEIIAKGYGRVYTIPPNVRYRERFQMAQEEARDKGKGIWD